MVSHEKWIFGLSVDEDLRWAACRIDVKKGTYAESNKETLQGVFCVLPKTKTQFDIHELVLNKLSELKMQHVNLFKESISVGVSCIGCIDTKKHRMLNIDRKNWALHETQDDSDEESQRYLIDFKSIIEELFEHPNITISVHNDATAKALAEYREQFFSKGPKSDILCYVNFHDGVNAGFVEKSKNPNVEMLSNPITPLMHHELGHIFPPLHPLENFDDKYSGCPIHSRCFVGLAGNARIMKQWRTGIGPLRHHKDNPWEIISHYIAHFCWNCVLTFPPKRILLSGIVVTPDLLPLIQGKFGLLNSYHGRPYIDYPEIRSPNFISMAAIPVEAAGVMGGLELARRANQPLAQRIDMEKSNGR